VSFTTAAITHLEQTSRIEQVVDGDTEKYRLLSPEEYREEVSEPQMEPIRTVYEKGSVSGCHDNAVFAMVAFLRDGRDVMGGNARTCPAVD